MIFVLFALALCLPARAWAQPAWGTVTPFSGTGASCSGSVTVAGTNPIVVAAVAIACGECLGTVVSANLASSPLSFVDAQNVSGVDARLEVWLIHSPPTGTIPFEALFSLGQVFNCLVVVLSDAHQAAALGDTDKATDSSSEASVAVASAADELVLDFVYGVGSGWDCTAGAGQTERYDDDASGDLICISTEPGAESVTMSHTLNDGPGFWTQIALAIKEAAGVVAPTAAPRRRLIETQ